MEDPSPKGRTGPASFRWESLDVFQEKVYKHPYKSFLASFFLPGLGSILEGQTRKGLFLLVPYLVVFTIFLSTVMVSVGLIFIPFLFYLWVLGMIDATAFIRERKKVLSTK